MENIITREVNWKKYGKNINPIIFPTGNWMGEDFDHNNLKREN